MIRLLLTSGRGPAECRIALRKTLGILVKEAEIAGVTVDVTVDPDWDGQGPASAITIIEGEGEEAFVTTWIGSILWVVQSPLRSHHKRKNWFIGVFRLEGPHLSRYRSNWPTCASKRSVPAARAASTRTRPRARCGRCMRRQGWLWSRARIAHSIATKQLPSSGSPCS
jgi:hypothetical protein